jgi:GNAT superfamily N-acetyltransferase
LEFHSYGAAGARDRVGEFLDTYAEVYGVPPYANDPFFSVEAYERRFKGAFEMPQFQIVAADEHGAIVGSAHGVKLPSSIPGWQGFKQVLPATLVDATEAGEVFWLRELMVRPRYRGKGLGRQLHNQLLRNRDERFVALTVIIDNEPANSAYLRWGYDVVARIRHAPERPLYDAMYRLIH